MPRRSAESDKLFDGPYIGSTFTRNLINCSDTSMGNSLNRTSKRNSPAVTRKYSSSCSVSSKQPPPFENRRNTLTSGQNSFHRETCKISTSSTVRLKDHSLVTRRNSGDSGYNSCEKTWDNSRPSRGNSLCTDSCNYGKKSDLTDLSDGIVDLDKWKKTRSGRTDSSVLLSGSSRGSLGTQSLFSKFEKVGLEDNSHKTSYIGERPMIRRSPKGCSDGLVGLQNLGNTEVLHGLKWYEPLAVVKGFFGNQIVTLNNTTTTLWRISRSYSRKGPGNECFMNSILQCLSHCKPLRDKLIGSNSLHHNSQSKMRGKLISAFVDLIKTMWSRNKSEIAVSPHSFKLQIQRFSPRFVGYDQQDSQEFLRFLLDGLHEDLNEGLCRRSSRTSSDLNNLSENELSEYMWRKYNSRDNSLVTDLFCGQMMSTLTCTKCNHRSVTFDPFWDLSLSIPRRSYSYSSSRFSDPSVTLLDCLTLFTKKEELDGDEKPKCEKCKVRQKCYKQFKIQRFPRILVLHLKRFSGFGFRSKLQTDVNFPLNNLDMSQFASRPSGSLPVKYNLFAVSNHSGSTFGGHYTAYCRHPESKEWHSFNDSRVSALSSSSVRGSQAYVLFYEMEDFQTHVL